MPLKEISIIISDISDTSELLPLILLLLCASYEKKYNLLKTYFFLTSVLKIYALVTSRLGINNMHAYHILSIVELVFMYCFYSIVLNKKNFFYVGLLVLLIFNIYNTLKFNKVDEFNNVAWALNASIIIIFGLLYFYELYKKSEYIQIERFPMFYINAGFLIYASGSFFTYLFGWKILSTDAVGLFHNAWLIQSISNIIKNIVIANGVWLIKTK